jgi:hypothetical protein
MFVCGVSVGGRQALFLKRSINQINTQTFATNFTSIGPRVLGRQIGSRQTAKFDFAE